MTSPAPQDPAALIAEAERGGLWIKMRRVFVDRAEQYQKADRYEMCSAIADAAARELVDLAALHASNDALTAAQGRVAELEAALLSIADRDYHYRTPPAPKPDGGLRGWAGHRAVRALTGQHGSYVSQERVREALVARHLSTPPQPDLPPADQTEEG